MITSRDRSLTVDSPNLVSSDLVSAEEPLTLANFSPRSLRQAQLTEAGELIGGRSGNSKRLTLMEKAHLKAAYHYLYKVPADATPGQHLEAYVEAHYHLCEAGAWVLQRQLFAQNVPAIASLPEGERSSETLSTPDTGIDRLALGQVSQERFSQERSWHQALGDFGYYTEQVEVYRKGLYGLTGEQRIPLLQPLGEAYRRLGQFTEAEAIGQELLVLAQSLGDRSGAMQGWEILGYAARYQGQYPQALTCHHRQLELAQDPQAQAYAWLAIGVVQENLDVEEALQSFRNAQAYLDLLEAGTDALLSMNIWTGLADACLMSGQYTKAIDYATQVLNINTQVNNRFHKCEALLTLGNAYTVLHQGDLAETALHQALKLARSGGYQSAEIRILNSLGVLYGYTKKRYSEAIDVFQRALNQSKTINDLQGLVTLHCHLANCYHWIQATEKARYHYRQAREFYPYVQDANSKVSVLACFARCDWQEGKIGLCLINLARCFWILPPWKSANTQLILREAKKIIGDKLEEWRVWPVANEADTPPVAKSASPIPSTPLP